MAVQSGHERTVGRQVKPQHTSIYLVARANLKLGSESFQSDFDDGTLGFRDGFAVKDHEIDEAIVANPIDTNIFGYAKYVRGLKGAIGGPTVEDAILEGEGGAERRPTASK